MPKEAVKKEKAKKDAVKLEDFLLNVPPESFGFVQDTHSFLLERGCGFKIETAANGYVFSYLLPKTKKVLANYFFRKKGMFVRIYGDNIGKYAEILGGLPTEMQRSIENATSCKRLHDPEKCNHRCPMGYIFELNGKEYKNCRYGCFQFAVVPENHAATRAFLEREFNERMA
jgi:hypothetical protein